MSSMMAETNPNGKYRKLRTIGGTGDPTSSRRTFTTGRLHLSATEHSLLAEPAAESSEERGRQEQLAKLEAWLAECDKVAELWEGEFDAATDVRRMRDER